MSVETDPKKSKFLFLSISFSLQWGIEIKKMRSATDCVSFRFLQDNSSSLARNINGASTILLYLAV